MKLCFLLPFKLCFIFFTSFFGFDLFLVFKVMIEKEGEEKKREFCLYYFYFFLLGWWAQMGLKHDMLQ